MGILWTHTLFKVSNKNGTFDMALSPREQTALLPCMAAFLSETTTTYAEDFPIACTCALLTQFSAAILSHMLFHRALKWKTKNTKYFRARLYPF